MRVRSGLCAALRCGCAVRCRPARPSARRAVRALLSTAIMQPYLTHLLIRHVRICSRPLAPLRPSRRTSATARSLAVRVLVAVVAMEHFGSQRYEKENQQHVHVPVLSNIVSWMRGPAPVPVAAPQHPQTPNPSASVAIAAAVPLPQSRAISRANSSTSVVSMGQSPMPTSYMSGATSLGLPTRSPSQTTMPRARSSSAVCELSSSSPGTPAMTPVGSPNPAVTRSHISLSPSLFALMGPPTHHHAHRPVAFKL